jgi:protein involved in polysaccharide export with SLBB domain
VTVDGEVGRPERYVIENDLTVLGVIARAGGLGKFASSRVRVIREADQATVDSTGFKPCSKDAVVAAASVCREIDIKDVRKGKVQDVRLLPNDTVIVSRRRF